MHEKVDGDAARHVLSNAYKDAIKKDLLVKCNARRLIDFVLENTHKTYKYILVTALLAKATNETINPLCLQAGSDLPGAYDARSICHNVIVPFDMTELGKALGGSNEPFLNKPARFTELSLTNAVRKENDREILKALCDDLPKIKDSATAYENLIYALQILIAIRERNRTYMDFCIDSLPTDATRLYGFISDLLNDSKEGETLTLVIAGLFDLFMSHEKDYKIEVHPVNQSGASSKEVSDLDIYKNGRLYIANELKDKAFTDTDIRHAVDKARAAGKTRMNFIVGRNGSCAQNLIDACMEDYLEKNFIVNVANVDEYVLFLLNMIECIDVERFMKFIIKTAMETKFKEETVEFLRRKAREHFEIGSGL
jgi:hypothetical protein